MKQYVHTIDNDSHVVHSKFILQNTSTPLIYTLSLHDALPIFWPAILLIVIALSLFANMALVVVSRTAIVTVPIMFARSEEHTSELQSRRDLVCRLLLEKKKEKHMAHVSLVLGIYRLTNLSK